MSIQLIALLISLTLIVVGAWLTRHRAQKKPSAMVIIRGQRSIRPLRFARPRITQELEIPRPAEETREFPQGDW